MKTLFAFVRKHRNTIITVLSIIAVSLPFFIHPYVVRGGSMTPTLSEGERLVVETLSLRIVPPKRGEILIFRNPHDKSVVEIKRVIGLPTETVELDGSGVTVIYADGTQEHFENGTDIGGTSNSQYRIHLGPEDYFVLGDNRSQSSDSRTFGGVQKADLIGRVIMKP